MNLDFLGKLPPHTVFVIAGPTASGKSALALQGAQSHGGAILNADCIQIYKGLPLLTACPSKDDVQKVPHKMYQIFPANSPLISAVSWVTLARSCIDKLLEQGLYPWVVGGTGFYLQALMQGLSPIPSIPLEEKGQWLAHRGLTIPPMPHQILSKAQKKSEVEQLKKELAYKDPLSAKRLMDRQRLLYALMVVELTGRPLSSWQSLPRSMPPYFFYRILVWPSLQELIYRMEQRFEAMLDKGVEEEVSAFCRQENLNSPLCRSIGFYALKNLIDQEISLGTCRDLYHRQARQYIKRQRTWFAHRFSPHIVIPQGIQ